MQLFNNQKNMSSDSDLKISETWKYSRASYYYHKLLSETSCSINNINSKFLIYQLSVIQITTELSWLFISLNSQILLSDKTFQINMHILNIVTITGYVERILFILFFYFISFWNLPIPDELLLQKYFMIILN